MGQNNFPIRLLLVLGLNLLAVNLSAAILNFGIHESGYYSISAPVGWGVKSSAEGYGTEIFLPPRDDNNFADLSFRVNILKFPATLESYDQAVRNAIHENLTTAQLQYGKLGPYPAHSFIYERNENNHPSKILRIYTFVNGIVFDIIFSCESKNYEQYLPTINAIIKSFSVKTIK